MKRLSRGRNATLQAVAINSRKEHESKRVVSGGKHINHGQQALSLPKSRSSPSVELDLETQKLPDFEFVTDGWIDPFPPPQYTQIPVPTQDVSNPAARTSSNSNVDLALSLRRETRRINSSPPARSHSPAKSIMTTRGRKSSFSSTSTLFESSSAVPITIVVTTPDEIDYSQDYSVEMEGEQITSAGNSVRPSIRKFRNDSTMSLPAFNTPFILDSKFLMPPINSQVDTRRMRKAREFEETRRFLIGFLNTKGSQLPRILRTRIMSVYGITDANLDPKVAAKFGGEGADLDEAVVLDLGIQGTVPTDRDLMRVLEMAYQSVLPTPTPTPTAQDLLAARKKRMSMPAKSNASIHSVDSFSSQISASGSASQQVLDSIMSNRAMGQRNPSGGSSRPASISSQTPSYMKRRSLQTQPTQRSFNPQPIVVLPQHKISTPPVKTRPQSLYRQRTDPTPAKPATVNQTTPFPAFNQNTSYSKPRQLRTESSPALSSLSHRPTVSSQLTRSPLTANFPQRPLSLVQERQGASIDLDALPSTFFDQEPEKNDSPTDSLEDLYMKSSWIAPLVTKPTTPPPSIKAATLTVKSSPKATRVSKPKPIPAPIKILPQAQKPQTLEPPPILAPTPITPTHNLTHKHLTLSEISDMEKPIYVRKRRSSSTLDAVSPKSPSFPFTHHQPANTGYDSNSSGMVFPIHPAFAPLGKERSRASMKVEEKRHTEKWGNSITISVHEEKGGKLKKEKKEKRGSMFGNLKRSFFGKG